MSAPNGHAQTDHAPGSGPLPAIPGSGVLPISAERIKELVSALEVPFEPSQIDKRPARWIRMLTALRWKTPSVLLNHHLGSLDDGRHGVPLPEVQLVGAPTRDCTLNQVFTDTHDDMSHDSAKHDFLNRTLESVSR